MTKIKRKMMSFAYLSKCTRKFEFFLKKTISSVLVLCLLASIVGIPTTVSAQEGYAGQEMVRSHQTILIEPDKAMTYEIKFKNTGTAIWRNDGSNFVALATVEPEKRDSVFKHSFWNEESYRPARLLEPIVAPGEIGTFRFALKAPDTVGSYVETFQAVAKNLAWVEGTKFSIPIEVTFNTSKQITSKPTESTVSNQRLEIDYPVGDSAYTASWPQGQVIELSGKPGEQSLLSLSVKNSGTATWKNTGSRYISMYSVRPNYHDSDLHSNGPGWMNKSQIRLGSASVAPGDLGTITVLLQFPKKEGQYVDYFRLASENYSWMKDGEIKIITTINDPDSNRQVGSRIEKVEEDETTDPSDNLYRDRSYQAKFLISSASELIVEPGRTIDFQVGFKNNSSKTWKKSGSRFVSMYTIEPSYRASRFALNGGSLNKGWISSSQIVMDQEEVGPGAIAYFKFTITAPSTSGVYSEKFRLAVEDLTWIEGGEYQLPITVRGGNQTSPVRPDTTTLPVPSELGPEMRVGLYNSEAPFILTTDSPFEVRSGNGELLGSLPAGSEVRVEYSKVTDQYTINAIGINRTQSDHVIIQALDHDTITEIVSLEKRVPWNPAINENLFRGSVEIRHSRETQKTWAINVLPMELYLRGIAETSSSSPVEFLKVMTLAARTYATYHYERQTKHADEHFFVDSTFDQVYRGYSLEQRHPSLTEAVLATAGEVVTYTDLTTNETKIAITPYFSQSDGRTRSWSEVWGANVPWCVSKPAPFDARDGKNLLGHGVGMSAREGLLMVVEGNNTYDQVLRYFYEGIVIQDRY